MLILLHRWLLVLFLLLVATAVYCGTSERTFDLDLPISIVLACCAMLGWLFGFLFGFFEPKGNMIDLEKRLESGKSDGTAGILLVFPALVLLAAPGYFILTGALLTSLVAGLAAIVMSCIYPPIGLA